ncbi:hypothetical protein ACIHAX_15305 [Nocardia sp. NPDC051929]
MHHPLEWEPDAEVVAVDYIGFASNLANLDAVIVGIGRISW